jgi:serine O-acetyltransferase
MKSVEELPASTASLAGTLLEIRRSRALVLPVKSRVHEFADDLLSILFPHFCSEVYYSPEELEGRIKLIQRDLKHTLSPLEVRMKHSVEKTVARFIERLPDIHAKLLQDAKAIYEGDPAAESVDEVISAYPGFLAISVYRIAHEFYVLGVPIFPRILTEYAHQKTGIDIHPGAAIGSPFFIDHGTGIVIGETTVIGDRVKIYQGVTLGALSVSKDLSSKKRHPTIQDNVVVYSNATILGGETVVGHDSVIGGNVWLTESVRPNSIVYHKSEVKVRSAQDE